jgi:hypothetical protein
MWTTRILQGLATRYQDIAIRGLSATEIGLLKKMLKSVYTNPETARGRAARCPEARALKNRQPRNAQAGSKYQLE